MKSRTVTTLWEFLFLTLLSDAFAEYKWRQHQEKRCSLSLQPLLLAQETMIIRSTRNHRASHKETEEPP